jgi:riboflavin kinase/FMN adenylyltransferase
MTNVRLTVLGSGTSVGVPTIGCRCDVCQSPDSRDKRLRPSVLIEYNDRVVLIDTTPDFRQQMLRTHTGRLDAILYTHSHADHILGLDDVRPYNFYQQGTIPIYAAPDTLEVVERVFSYIFFTGETESSRPRIHVNVLDGTPFDLFGLEFQPIALKHGRGNTLGYRFGRCAYLTDHSDIPPASLEQLRGLDVLFLDALRHKPHPTHSTVERSLKYVEQLAPRRAYFTHISHDLGHVQTESLLPPHVHLAYDGLQLDISEADPIDLIRLQPNAVRTEPCAVTIGNFDGTHLAHQQLFRRVVKHGRERALIPSVLTFDPHPTQVLSPDRAPKLLSTHEQRAARMADFGIEQVFVLPFNKELSALEPREFIDRILVEQLNAKLVVIGSNFKFGRKQAGDVALLVEEGKRMGFAVEVVNEFFHRGETVSSTLIRRLLEQGEVARAARYLGRCYRLTGRIVAGFGIGKVQTVPTLNLNWGDAMLPKSGVYVTRTTDIDTGRVWPSITNVGVRPTFQGEALTVETFLLAALEPPSPHRIELEFLHWIREERRFTNPDALKAQILKDVKRAKSWYRHADWVAKAFAERLH